MLRRQVLLPTLLEALAGWIGFRHDVQFGDQVLGGLVDARMVLDHQLRELFDGRRLSLGCSELPGGDVDLVCGDDDGCDLGISRLPFSPGADAAQGKNEGQGGLHEHGLQVFVYTLDVTTLSRVPRKRKLAAMGTPTSTMCAIRPRSIPPALKGPMGPGNAESGSTMRFMNSQIEIP